VPDGSGIAAAIDYSLNRWTPLGRILEDGNVSRHNNHPENLMRPWGPGSQGIAVRRQRTAGKRAAMVMNLVQSARMYGHDSGLYLRDVLSRLPTPPGARDRLLAAAPLDAAPEGMTAYGRSADFRVSLREHRLSAAQAVLLRRRLKGLSWRSRTVKR
jgi:hypothetical protein